MNHRNRLPKGGVNYVKQERLHDLSYCKIEICGKCREFIINDSCGLNEHRLDVIELFLFICHIYIEMLELSNALLDPRGLTYK